jgi:LysM repeat protein
VFVLSPLFVQVAQAGTFSFIEALFAKVSASTDTQSTALNSQTLPLLAAAVNLDPNPSIGGGDISVVGGALVPQEGPSGTAADIIDRPSSSQISVYTVRNGDTLSGIANMYDVKVNTILWANDIQDGIIHEGDLLIILPINGVRHAVVKGDTIASLAKTYKSNAHDIASYNGLADTDELIVGNSIIIPNGVVPPTAAQIAATAHSKSISSIASGKKTEPYLGGGGPEVTGYFIWPVAGGVITQGLHGWNAVDIGAPKNTPIYAAAEGTVIIAKNNSGWNGGYGNYVVIQHPNGTQTLYGHANSTLVSVGDHVVQGQKIALMGRTGEATGYHLHFEVRGAANPFAN